MERWNDGKRNDRMMEYWNGELNGREEEWSDGVEKSRMVK
jgi:hypothetical protein